jgi:hypothetical protein
MNKEQAIGKLEYAIDYYLYTDMDGFERILNKNDSLEEARSKVVVKPDDIKSVELGEDEYLVAQRVIERGVRELHKEYRNAKEKG